MYKTAKEWAKKVDMPDFENRICQSDISQLPWKDCFFNFVISTGVLDSLPFDIAKKSTLEIARVMKPEAIFYCDLISGDDSQHAREYAEEEVVKTKHEEGTIQSYFNHTKIKELFSSHFEILEAVLVRRENTLQGNYYSRHYLTLKKRVL